MPHLSSVSFWKCTVLFCSLCIIVLFILCHASRGSSGSIVTDYGLDDRAIEVRSPTGAEDFSSSPCVQTGSGAHPASYPMGTSGTFPGGKARPGRDACHLVPRLSMSRSYTSSPPCASMACSGIPFLFFAVSVIVIIACSLNFLARFQIFTAASMKMTAFLGYCSL
jgi:hypothetical protein